MSEYDALKARIASGWNTWNTYSVFSHVLLPHGCGVNLSFKEHGSGATLRNAFIERRAEGDERIRAGVRSYDGAYTELNLKWNGIDADIISAKDGDDLVVLISLNSSHLKSPTLMVEFGMLWGREGSVEKTGESLRCRTPEGDVSVYVEGNTVFDPYLETLAPYASLSLDSKVGISTGSRKSLHEIESIISKRKTVEEERISAYGELSSLYQAIQTCMAWNTVYDPLYDRVITPVSRLWAMLSGGYVLFCWDTCFAALMAAIDNKDIAYSNIIELTREVRGRGFVPNAVCASGFESLDRSQPPVGSLAVRDLFRRFGDRWLLEEVFDDLLTWNRWWYTHRRNGDGLYSWGSNPYEPRVGNGWETNGVNERFGGSLESGLDNSPVYDDIPFDKKRHQLCLSDAGLSGLYLMDCRALEEIAGLIGRTDEANELHERADDLKLRIESLWDEESGIYLNRRTDTGEFSSKLSPMNFYPTLGGAATQEQCERMVKEHLLNPDEFWGEWVIPSISRNDPAYHEQDYWRGRIWGPLNFLVYRGLLEYDVPEARAALAEKSRNLLLKEWTENGHVYENYSAVSGYGHDKGNSTCFYHWGGLLGLISFYEAGNFVPKADNR